KKIAPDPILEPTRALPWFLERLARSGKPIKAALLDQAIVAGVGNIYADEALHAAGIHPRTKASRAKNPQRLWDEILRILEESIKQGGSTIRDYVSAEGKAGSFAEAHHVYGRSGEPCPVCGTPISKITLGGRGTHFCPKCQSARAARDGIVPPKVVRKSGKSRRARPRRRSRS
ncbi:MAG: zinc finger domain-containing protein, partial [Bdellovibrionota bacterium]